MQTITLEEAQARLLEVVHCVMSEKVELLRSIDRILAEDVYAHVSQPPFERSAMDGRKVDEVATRTGFRKTRFGKGMIWLNDRVIQMKGFAQRTSKNQFMGGWQKSR